MMVKKQIINDSIFNEVIFMMRKRLISSTLVIGLLLSSATGCASTSKILKDAEQRSLADSKDAHTMETSTSSTTDATTTVPSETEIDITTGYDPYVGAIVTYGNYAGSPIEWIVLDKGENDELSWMYNLTIRRRLR